jgi:hypothetical protein
MADRFGRVLGQREEPPVFGRFDRFDQFGGDRREWNGVRLKILGLRPVDDLFFRVPLIDMEAGDFLNALSSQHDELYCTRIGGMNRSIRAFQPAIELHELVL